MAADSERLERHEHRAGPAFWITAVMGWALIAVGIRGVLSHRIDARPGQLARFVVGGALIHDLLVAPVVILLGVALARVVRGRARAVVQGALVVSAMLALFSYPLVRAYGKAARNPTSLPHNYAANLAVILGLVWAVAAVLVIVRMRKAGRRVPPS